MDAVEVARRSAAELHAKLVAAGHDPRQPYAFALAAAKDREFDVESTASGATLLNGARATLLSADRLILHERIGSAFEQAFLVAHEIGHAECGDDQASEPAPPPDPVRAAEPTPTGLDRVVDYGRRQRREVQMDLFARELLLPRGVVRALHVADRLTASCIAERFGAPVEVVAQQLLDALLLPPIPVPVQQTLVERPPNDDQRAAAAHRGSAYLLEAGPGTGKTQTLVLRVMGLLAEGIDPRRILLLTFSNKAAGEMAERIAQQNKAAAAAMWIGTFHAFGLDIVRRFHAEFGLPADPRMLDRTEAVELLEDEFAHLGLVRYRNIYDPTQVIADILAAISRAKDEVVDAKRYAELAGQMRGTVQNEEERILAEKADEVARVYGAYESLKRKANCVDFGDLVLMPVQLLEGHESVRSHLSSQYDHILVDEYQDVNRSSVRLLTALCPSGCNLWVVGDAKQSIYRFRGASSYNVSRFGREDFPGGTRGQLNRNYRSVSEVVTAFSNFAASMNVCQGVGTMVADRGPSGNLPILRTAEQSDAQAILIADAVQEMRSAGYGFRDQAVLCTGNETLSNLGRDLEKLGIPVLFLGSLFERSEVKDLLSFLSILVDGRAMGLVRVATLPDFTMSIGDVATTIDHLRERQTSASRWWEDAALRAKLSAEAAVALDRLSSVFAGLGEAALPWNALVTILFDRTRMAAEIAMSGRGTDQAKGIAIWQLMNFLRAQPAGAGLPIRRVLDRIRRLLRLGDDRDLRNLPLAAQTIDAVRLMTIHGAKGLEFPVVHIPGLNANTLPRAASEPSCPPPTGLIEGAAGTGREVFRAAHAAEQECLFYVALSRARDRLVLYATTKNAAGARRSVSPFVDRLGAAITRIHVTPTRLLPLSADVVAIPLIVDGGLRFTAQQIALYESCSRRFFYTHVLQVGGRRTTTPFMQMHDAVRSVFESLTTDGVSPSEPELTARISKAFDEQGLTGHGYENEYRSFAVLMLSYFVGSRKGRTAERPTALRMMFGGEEIVVRPDEVLIRSDGIRTLRRVRTGHQRSADAKDVGAAAFLIAARDAFPGSVAEIVYLSDQHAEPIAMSARELQNRHDKLAEFLRQIRAGEFPAAPSARVCPGCPAFFICGPTPAGVLQKKF